MAEFRLYQKANENPVWRINGEFPDGLIAMGGSLSKVRHEELLQQIKNKEARAKASNTWLEQDNSLLISTSGINPVQETAEAQQANACKDEAALCCPSSDNPAFAQTSLTPNALY